LAQQNKSDASPGPRLIIVYSDLARQHSPQSSLMEIRSSGFIGAGHQPERRSV
jgi:hypothetical protein